MKAGGLVIYKNSVAVVLSAGEKFEIAFLSGEKGQTATQSVREKDFAPLCEGSFSVSDLKRLCEAKVDVSRDSLCEARSFFEGEEKIPFFDIAEILFECFEPFNSFALFALLRDSPFFELSAERSAVFFRARSEDEARAIEEKKSAANAEKAMRESFLARLSARSLDLPGDFKFMQDVEQLALGISAKSRTLREAGVAETPEAAHKVLLQCGIWDILKNPHPSRRGIFALERENSLPPPPDEERIFLDFPAYAIDNAWSGDPDDAISFDGNSLWVHVADPASAVLEGSPLDLAARERGATLYSPDGEIWMLNPASFEDYALGLKNPSRSLSFKIELDEEGGIAKTEIFKTTLNVCRMSYGEADLQKDSAEMRAFFDIARSRAERRRKNGAVFIEMPESRIFLKDGIVNIEPIKRFESADMVREMMLLAGEAAAHFAFKNSIPFAFASQSAPTLPENVPEGLAGEAAKRKSMPPRSLGIRPAAHCGLGLALYSQVTSPLRRYVDLACHLQLRKFLDKKPLLKSDEFLAQISAADIAAANCAKAERESRAHFIGAYLLQNCDWRGEGIVVDLKANVAAVAIPSLGFEAQILNQNFSLNEKLSLKAGKIDLPSLKIGFQAV